MKEYVTVEKDAVVETVIEKSRFISACKRVDSVEDAVAFVEAQRKKYFDATHNCFAYLCDDKAKFSDDGEPQGTAGMPIFECLKNNKLDHVCVVVTRYFGGVKLGAGGLVRAYSGGASEVLKLAGKLQIINCIVADVTVEYTFFDNVKRNLLAYAKVIGETYDDKVTLKLLFPATNLQTITNVVTEYTFGKGCITEREQILSNY